ncbi:MAG: hypothetical protein ACP5NE_03225, partial [Candidatus Micrarchaeia archaeon]
MQAASQQIESQFSPYLKYNNNFANFEVFYTANATPVPCWIESNQTGKLITWCKINNPVATNGIAIGFFST